MLCKNCQQNLQEGDRYCNQCGAKVVTKRLQVRELLKEWATTIFNVDNKFLITILHLLTKPSNVIVGYINGVRKKYFIPINFILLALGLYGIFILAFPSSGYLHEEVLSGFFSYEEENYLETDQFKYLRILNLPILLSQIPILALISRLIYGRTYNFAENLIVNSYWLSYIILGSLIICFLILMMGGDANAQANVVIPFILIYTFYVHRKIYPRHWVIQVFKYFSFMIISLVLLSVYFIVLGFLIVGEA